MDLFTSLLVLTTLLIFTEANNKRSPLYNEQCQKSNITQTPPQFPSVLIVKMKMVPSEIFVPINSFSNRTAAENSKGLANVFVYSERLGKLRKQIKAFNLSGYIIPNEDDHHSEFPADRDKHCQYITGFTGLAGHVLVTMHHAILWLDSRYHVQAERQLPLMWTLLKVNDSSSASVYFIEKWLTNHFKGGARIAADPKKIVGNEWIDLANALKPSKIELVPLQDNLVDLIWEQRPPYSKKPIFIHDTKYCGKHFAPKLGKVRSKMNQTNSDVLVLSKLEEIAWLFNLRGSDITYSPLFVSYALVLQNSANLYLINENVTDSVRTHLNDSEAKVDVKPYNKFWDDLAIISKTATRVFIPLQSSFAVHMKVPENVSHVGPSPIIDMKAVKNHVEVQGSRNAQIRDAIALCSLFKFMERDIFKTRWHEMKVDLVLNEMRQNISDELYYGPSFRSHIAFRENGAMPLYSSSQRSNSEIDKSAPLVIDVGAQYLDGTTETTRVLHFGTPTSFQKDVYTSILQGVIDLADTVFLKGARYELFDFILRRPLMKMGLTFDHATTHSTGVFSSVYEDYNGTFFENLIVSQEPGYYLKDNFGMRLDNLYVVTKAEIKNGTSKKFLGFSPLTLVPYEQKLINVAKLDFRQITWLNSYHYTVLKQVGAKVKEIGDEKLYIWLVKKTKPISFSV